MLRIPSTQSQQRRNAVAFLESLALLLPASRPVLAAEVQAAAQWRAVREYPGFAPADMAISVGREALRASERPPEDVRWVLHGGSGLQGSAGWPVHHHIQHGIVGANGNALEVKQYCSGGLTSWLLATGLLVDDGVVVCTGADNWSWDDRFVAARAVGGEPFSDVAHAAVLSKDRGFAKIIGVGTASCAGQADVWQTRESFWEHATLEHYGDAYARAVASRTEGLTRDSFKMLTRAVTSALADARVSPQYVTHFVPHGSGSGEPYRTLAKAMDLPWSTSLYEHNLDSGYLGVSTQVAGVVHLIETGQLAADSIVLLLAAEYQLSATAMVMSVRRLPRLSQSGLVKVAA
jgi:3-oxoacyl-[acyl-carrier-protein] synthase III